MEQANNNISLNDSLEEK